MSILRNFISFLSFVMLFPLAGAGQSSDVFPLQPVLFSFNHSIFNPSVTEAGQKATVKLLNSSFINLNNTVGFNILEGSFKVKERHTPGLFIYSEQETEYLRRSKVMARYSYNLPVSEQFSLNSGISFGFFNYFVRATNSSAGASVFSPDGNLGLSLNAENLKVGVSVNQIFNSIVSPVNRSFVIRRFYTGFAEKKFSVSPFIDILFSTQSWYSASYYKGIAAIMNVVLYNNFLAGGGGNSTQSLFFNIGIQKFSIISFQGDLLVAYQQGFGKVNSYNASRIEILLKLYLSSEEQ